MAQAFNSGGHMSEKHIGHLCSTSGSHVAGPMGRPFREVCTPSGSSFLEVWQVLIWPDSDKTETRILWFFNVNPTYSNCLLLSSKNLRGLTNTSECTLHLTSGHVPVKGRHETQSQVSSAPAQASASFRSQSEGPGPGGSKRPVTNSHPQQSHTWVGWQLPKPQCESPRWPWLEPDFRASQRQPQGSDLCSRPPFNLHSSTNNIFILLKYDWLTMLC